MFLFNACKVAVNSAPLPLSRVIPSGSTETITSSPDRILYPDERRTNKTKPWQAFAISKKENIITIPSTEVGIYS